MSKKYIAWFSCGAASATATKLALHDYGIDSVRILYQETGSEHPDNARFLADCERWFGKQIERHKSADYTDIWDVFQRTRWLVGPAGARCTSELKRKVAEQAISWGRNQEWEVFGYTVDEAARVERFKKNNNERKILTPLIDRGFSKDDCLGFIDRAGIEIPAMYRLGYQNNNCIGCVKGQQGYWNKIRQDFPEVYDRMAKVERDIGAAINKRYEGSKRIPVYLDELPPDAGRNIPEPSIQCGIICMSEYDDIS